MVKIKNFWKKLVSLHASYQCYFLGIVFCLVGLPGASYQWCSFGFFTVAMCLSMALFLCGFIIRYFPWVRTLWSKTIGKIILGAIHIPIPFLSAALARDLLIHSFGLPANSFEFTQHIIEIICILPIWSFIITIFMLLILVALIVGFILSFMLEKYCGVASIISNKAKMFQGKVKTMGNVCALDMLGVVSVIYVLTLAGKVPLSISPNVVKYIAYVSDYRIYPNYPGIDHTKKSVLLDNGLVSYAEETPKGIKIWVDNVKQ